MNVDESRRTATSPHRASPIALRAFFVIAAGMLFFLLGTASAEADEERSDSSASEHADDAEDASDSQAHGTDADGKDATTKGEELAELLPAPDGGTQGTPDSSEPSDEGRTEPDSEGSEEPVEAPSDAGQDAPAGTDHEAPSSTSDADSQSGESSTTQGETPDNALSKTVDSVTDGVDRAVAPTLDEIDEGTRELGRDLDAAVGKDSQLTRVVEDVDKTVRKVNTVVSGTLRETEVVVKELAAPLRGENATPPPDAGTSRPASGRADVHLADVDERVKQPRSRVDHDPSAVPTTISTPSSVSEQSAPERSSLTRVKDTIDSSHSGLIGMTPGNEAMCASASNGGASGGSAGASVVLSPDVPLAAGVDPSIAGVDAVCPRSVGDEPIVAPD